MSSMSPASKAATNAPRRASSRTSPSRSSQRRASRTGVRETPSSLATRSWLMRSLGRSRPDAIWSASTRWTPAASSVAGTVDNSGRPVLDLDLSSTARKNRIHGGEIVHNGSLRSRAMDFDLGDEHVAIRETVRSFAESEVAPVAEELDREKRFPLDLVARLAELGLMGVPMPERYGGAGADTLAYAITVEELTRIDSSLGVTVAAHTSLGTSPILLFGSEEQKERLLPDLCSGRGLAAFGLTEPE